MIQDVGDKCCGCTACATVCPVLCISMDKDDLGFSRPNVNEAACIHCGQCRQVCPAIQIKCPQTPKSARCGWAIDDDMRQRSSSGGAFPAIASAVLADGGVVYGAIFDANSKRIVHSSSADTSLEALQGSKYVQSDLGDTFRRIQEDLKAAKKVLFVGTPCQVNGLKNLIGDEDSNLLTCDFFCHGVSSPLVFSEYLKVMEHRYRARVSSINFRDKSRGWRKSSMCIKFESGHIYSQRNRYDMFFRGYVDCFYHNTSCYYCTHNKNRSSDVTLADFWHYELLDKALNDEKGLALVTCNSVRGVDFINNALTGGFRSIEVPLNVAMIGSDEGEQVRLNALGNREKFTCVARDESILKAFKQMIGVSRAGMIAHKLRRIGYHGLFARIRRKIGV